MNENSKKDSIYNKKGSYLTKYTFKAVLFPVRSP
jgi:hypothetical protein